MSGPSSSASELAQEHAHVWAAIPWCVSGSATPEELARALAHTEQCADCRAEWALNERFREALGAGDGGATLAADPSDPTRAAEAAAADASLAALWRRIDADAAMSSLPAPSAAPSTAPSAAAPRPSSRRRPWIAVLAAASVLQALALAALAALWWQGAGEPRFETLSREPAAAPPVIHLQLAPQASESEVRALVQRLRQEPAVVGVAGPPANPPSSPPPGRTQGEQP